MLKKRTREFNKHNLEFIINHLPTKDNKKIKMSTNIYIIGIIDLFF